MAVKCTKLHKIHQHLPLQDPPKFTQFWFENIPSGNPGLGSKHKKVTLGQELRSNIQMIPTIFLNVRTLSYPSHRKGKVGSLGVKQGCQMVYFQTKNV
jgi:hypothetical protein